MRVVGGTYGGRHLRAPKGRDTRPTSDRVREALFSTLGAAVVDARVLDLFAGTGAVGIEALSRGAAAATFVERDPATARVLRDNLAALGISATVHRVAAERFVALEHDGAERFDLVFCDPPYTFASDDLTALLLRLVRNGWLADRATIVAERARHGAPLTLPEGELQVANVRTYGDTVLYYLRRNPTTQRSGGSSA
jgi:16S rRNA (guanine966-N2)-methyltransferase